MSQLNKYQKISVEGNISAGKSTIFEYLKTLNMNNISFADEPVKKWEQIKDKNNMNAIECFYANPNKNAFCFQVLAYITRLQELITTLKMYPNNIIISERCIETDKYVFAKMLYEKGNISSIEWETYNYWYNSFSEFAKVDLIIYIRTEPEECYNRIKKRNRSGEHDISLEYLQNCHIKHEEWINQSSMPVITIDGNDSIDIIQNKINKLMQKLIPTNTIEVTLLNEYVNHI